MHILRISLEIKMKSIIKEKTNRKECQFKFFATEVFFNETNPAQRNIFLPLEISFLLYFCSILSQWSTIVPFQILTVSNDPSTQPAVYDGILILCGAYYF